MSEVLTLEERFSELKDANGRVNWDVVLDMMKRRDLRPRLPDELDSSMRALVEECWHPDPEARPNCHAIAFRLSAILKDEAAGKTFGAANMHAEDKAKLLGRSIVELLWEIDTTKCMDEQHALTLGHEDLVASASDPILNAYLRNARGPECLQKLSTVMFFRDNNAVSFVPEPFLDKDIHVSPDTTEVRGSTQPAFFACRSWYCL